MVTKEGNKIVRTFHSDLRAMDTTSSLRTDEKDYVESPIYMCNKYLAIMP